MKIKNVNYSYSAMYKSIIVHSPFAISVRDAESNLFIDVNYKFEELFGYKREEIIGVNRFAINRTEDLENNLETEKLLLEGKIESFSVVTHYERKDKSKFWGRINRSLIKENGKLLVVSTILDVSEQKEAELDLQKSQLKYQILFNNSLNAIALYNFTTDSFVDCNESFTQLYGYTREQVKHIDVLDIVYFGNQSREFYEERFKENKDRMKTLQKVKMESDHKSKDGSLIKVKVILSPFIQDDELYIIQETMDITHEYNQKQSLIEKMEELKKANEELTRYIQSNQELQNFAYITSHDLKEPIRSIVSFAQLLDRSLELDEEQALFLKFIKDSGSKLEKMIEDILHYSKVNSESLEIVDICTKDITERILNDLHTIIQNKDAIFIFGKNFPAVIKGSYSHIYQLFQNLCKNAIKFNREGVNPIIKIKYESLNGFHQFCISDNGIGIDERQHQLIFQIFKKAKRSEEGTGIGLSVCKKVVELHNGKIWLKSELNKGTKFYFTISKDI